MVKYSDCPAQDVIEGRAREEEVLKRIAEKSKKILQEIKERQSQQFQNVPES